MSLVTVCSVIGNVNKVTGISLNLLLLHLITRYSRSSLGTYKYLLFVFASSDVILTIVHASINHQVVSVGTVFASVAEAESRYITAIYCAGFTLVFSLSIFNFLFRFWAVKCPHLVRLYSNKYFIAFLVVVAASTFLTWYLLCAFGCTGEIDEIGTIIAREEFRRRFGRTVIDGFQILDYWRDGKLNLRAALFCLAFDVLIVSFVSLICILAILSFYHVKKESTLSTQSLLLQRKLLVALCAQTSVPIFCVVIPYFTVLTLPFFDIDGYVLSVGCTALNSLFPCLDAIVIIWLTNDYREGLRAMLFGNKSSVTVMESTTVSRMHSSFAESNY